MVLGGDILCIYLKVITTDDSNCAVTDLKKCTLRAMVKEREQCPVDELLRIAGDIAEPLIFLHERQVVHRGE